MPPLRRRTMDRRATLDNKRVREHLLTGHDWFFLDPDGVNRERLADEDLREAWQQLAELLVEYHVFGKVPEGDDAGLYLHPEDAKPKPGSRPWAWWRWSAPEPRRRIGPGPDPIGPVDWYGVPSIYAGIPPGTTYESQEAYLRRHRLLLPAEAELLAAGVRPDESRYIP